jgi:glycosyltransferase involved in cell wall biosynthesis
VYGGTSITKLGLYSDDWVSAYIYHSDVKTNFVEKVNLLLDSQPSIYYRITQIVLYPLDFTLGDFLGKIEKNEDLENEIAKSCVAIAPYIEKLDTWTKYADPGKVKTYLACGVPVLLTGVPWNAKEIEKMGCGKIIEENVGSIANSFLELHQGVINDKYRKQALSYISKCDYKNIFKELSL